MYYNITYLSGLRTSLRSLIQIYLLDFRSCAYRNDVVSNLRVIMLMSGIRFEAKFG
jgi:hypothetical protein